ncbi:MAG: metal ABC transporter permease [Prevotellaceae bacterium]|nr:metal ABC transporter permease [Candidatus Faecinaster equi]
MFELLEYDFFQNALMASVMAGILCGIIGTYIVSARMVFVSGGIAHASLGGVGLFALLGWSPLLGATIAGLLTSLGIDRLSHLKEIRQDSAIAILWAVGMGVGVMCSYLSPTFLPSLSGFLFGDILLVTEADLLFLLSVMLVVVIFFLMSLPRIVSVTYDPIYAEIQGKSTTIINKTLLLLTALSIVACLRVSGVVLLIAMMTLPQLIANLYSGKFSTIIILSITFGIIGCLCGLYISYSIDIPCGPCITLILIAFYVLLSTIKKIKNSLI